MFLLAWCFHGHSNAMEGHHLLTSITSSSSSSTLWIVLFGWLLGEGGDDIDNKKHIIKNNSQHTTST